MFGFNPWVILGICIAVATGLVAIGGMFYSVKQSGYNECLADNKAAIEETRVTLRKSDAKVDKKIPRSGDRIAGNNFLRETATSGH